METFERDFKYISITKHTPEGKIAEFGKECQRCNHCCKVDSGVLFDDDITGIADYLQMPRDEFKKEYLEEHERFHTQCWKLRQIRADKPYGQCILLTENGCSVHEAKPKYCRLLSTASRQGQQLAVWFALNHFVNPNDPESIRQWAVYLKTHPTIPGGKLLDLVPDKEKLRAILNYEQLK